MRRFLSALLLSSVGLTGSVFAQPPGAEPRRPNPPRGGAFERPREEPREHREEHRGHHAVQEWMHLLADRMNDPHDTIRESARAGIVSIGPAALPMLNEIAKGPDDARATAARKLIAAIEGPRRMGPGGPGGFGGPRRMGPGGPGGFGGPGRGAPPFAFQGGFGPMGVRPMGDRGPRPEGERRPDAPRPETRRPEGDRRPEGERRPEGSPRPETRRPEEAPRPETRRPEGGQRPETRRPEGERRPEGGPRPETRRPEGAPRPEIRRPEEAPRPETRRPEGERRPEGRGVPEFAARGLSDKQQNELTELREQFQKRMQEIMSTVRGQASSPEARERIETIKTEFRNGMKKVLSEEQYEKFLETFNRVSPNSRPEEKRETPERPRKPE